MGEMAASLISKVEEVCSEPCAMAPECMIDALVAKLRNIIEPVEGEQEEEEEGGGGAGEEEEEPEGGTPAVYVDCQLKV